MLISMIRSHGASPARPARWITASAPALASVTAAQSVTDARMNSSAAPAGAPARAGGGTTSSRRSVRPGRASRGRSMAPIWPDPPVIRIVGTPVNITPSPPGRPIARITAGRPIGRSPPGRPIGRSPPARPVAKITAGRPIARITVGRSARVGLGVASGPGQEPEIAALVGLGHVLAVQRAVAALEPRRWRLPGGAPTGELIVIHFQAQRPLRHVESDQVTGAHQGERAADERLGRHMQDARAVAGAA